MEDSKKLQSNELNYNIKTIKSYENLLKNLKYYNHYFSPTLSELTGDLEKYAKKLFQNAINIEITDKNNERLGMVSFYANDIINNIAFITLIVVDKKKSHCGIGSILIKYAEEYCKMQKMQKMKLEVLKNNENALKFYRKNNYIVCEECDKTYYMIKEI